MVLFRQMISAVKRTLTAGANAPRRQHNDTPALSPEVQLLNHWCQTRQQLALESERGHHQSMILAVDHKRGIVWLDQPLPAAPALITGNSLHLCHHSGKHLISAETKIIATRDVNGTRTLAATLPRELRCTPRRRHWRYHPPAGTMSARVRAVGESPQQAEIVNLSPGGLRLALKGNFQQSLRAGTRLALCEFDLGGGQRLRCRASVKACRLESQPQRHTQVSVAFADITPAQQRLIASHLDRLARLSGTTGTIRAA